jgi:hypothetical protein
MTIEERLKNMERELGRVKRRNRWLLGAILLLAGGMVLAGVLRTTVPTAQAQGTGTAKELRANKFVLEDNSGDTRALLWMTDNGPSLGLMDKKSKLRICLSADKEGPSLALYNENGEPRTVLTVQALKLLDEYNKTRAGLILLENGPLLALYDEKGRGRLGMGVLIGTPALYLMDEYGNTVWSAPLSR